jgi:hypothetical protein
MHPNDFVMKRIDQIEAGKKAAEVKADAAFASDLGLKPGQWPQLLQHDGKDWLRGQPKRNADGELESVEYYRPSGRLTIFND